MATKAEDIKLDSTATPYIFLICILLILLISIICWKRVSEGFESLGLTQVKWPSWWLPVKAYNKNDSKSQMYLDRHPFANEVQTPQEADHIASTYRFWKQ